MKVFMTVLLISGLFSFNIYAKSAKKGDPIPNFKVQADNGEFIELSKFKGKWVILYFYPKDDTSGCTKEAITFSELKKEFEKVNAIVFGINKDNLESHRKFKKKHNITIPLLYDKTGEVSKFFGVKSLFGMCRRDTILINPEGKIEKIYRSVNPEGNPKEILEYIKKKSKGE
ncbi:peroxiredoxin Q/BCP [Thermotomaculum hydrothermale]|uniref:thioredoxin-dependent peroxiredoxin n=1 Tax=Thermotomaculum hydrothermale TaxID=981385 RepID=A0A7R6PHF0_9BACT|nr:peroxiredoxin [Thermotomaculum hydrothermale]BBB32649.1 peroxiredoxin Q/BCP [Thermotomaculum hydrothermale]